jgi:hypothetical protein
MRHDYSKRSFSAVKHSFTTEICAYRKATVKESLTVRIPAGFISTTEKFSAVQGVFA